MSTNVLATVLLMLILAATVSVSAISFTTQTTYATAGMGNCKDDPDEECTPQKDRVGNDDPDDEDADRDGPGGEGGSAGDPGQGNTGDPSDEGEANCWGKVSSALGHQQNERPGPAHSSDPVPGDDDNETPREGVGNQVEGHPSDHADTVGGFVGADTPDCVD
jgi:hypothetical protein